MSIKKYTNGSWTPACRKYGTETDSITAFPATIIGDGTPITSYTIKGNMEQNGTPTPSSPIYPSECGERTENLFDFNANNPDNGYVYGKELTSDGSVDAFPQTNVSEYISITPFGSYTFSYGSQYNDVYAALYNAKREFIRSIKYNGQKVITFYSQEDETYLRITYLRSNKEAVYVVEGSTAPTSYIPYGYKLPLTLGSTTTDIYLGEVQSTRRVNKLVLTGEEDWVIVSSRLCILKPTDCTQYSRSVSTHFIQAQGTAKPGEMYIGGSYINFNYDGVNNNVPDFKAYLAAQYAAGTPVTVWYVLETPTTGILNEPLRKIGDYADSVSGTGLATSGTGQAFDINTTLKPSEVDMTYHGWHEHEDTKYST